MARRTNAPPAAPRANIAPVADQVGNNNPIEDNVPNVQNEPEPEPEPEHPMDVEPPEEPQVEDDMEEFALTPALATKDPLEYTGVGSKIFKHGSEKLSQCDISRT
jgi:hypothetical protein